MSEVDKMLGGLGGTDAAPPAALPRPTPAAGQSLTLMSDAEMVQMYRMNLQKMSQGVGGDMKVVLGRVLGTLLIETRETNRLLTELVAARRG